MTIEQVRVVLGEEHSSLPDESIQSLIDLIHAVSRFVISTESGVDGQTTNLE